MESSEKKFYKIFHSSPDIIFITSADGKYLEVNDNYTRFSGYTREELIGHRTIEIETWVNLDDRDKILAKIQEQGHIYNEETQFRVKSGDIRTLMFSNEIIDIDNEPCIMFVGTDITERKKMEERLYLTDRLASVGEMASGVAHELNNPLTSIVGLSQLLAKQDFENETKEDLLAINSEAQRAAAIVKNLLTFARKHKPLTEPIKINQVIESVLKLRSYEHKQKNISVEMCLQDNLPEVIADFFQIQQVFLNLIMNAETAMIDAHCKGTLKIIGEKINNLVKISFSDDGPGISRENMGRIFNPFFTTKEVGKGTGLGLSICYGIITSHGGKIYAKSENGQGATFIVELPIVERGELIHDNSGGNKQKTVVTC